MHENHQPVLSTTIIILVMCIDVALKYHITGNDLILITIIYHAHSNHNERILSV